MKRAKEKVGERGEKEETQATGTWIVLITLSPNSSLKTKRRATAGGFSTKKFSVVLGVITFMWYSPHDMYVAW